MYRITTHGLTLSDVIYFASINQEFNRLLRRKRHDRKRIELFEEAIKLAKGEQS